LKQLHAQFQAGKLAPVVAVGTPDRTLSHFQAMDTLERGTATGNNDTGWMNRVLTYRKEAGIFSAVQFGSQLPLALSGAAPALVMGRIKTFGLGGYDDAAVAGDALRALYQKVDHPVATEVNRTLDALDQARQLNQAKYVSPSLAAYPTDSGISGALQDTAQLIKAKVGLSVVTMDVGGWDMHINEGTIDGGDMKSHLAELDATLGAFVADLGPEFANVTIVVLSEFGRTIRENGTVGTDHGHGQAVLVLGGSVAGGKVHGTWPGLAPETQFINGSLAATSDYRDVLGDVLRQRGAVGDLTAVFPDYAPKALSLAAKRA
jgi:uncharacterized protein (DUF1501 family)